nr:4Fe-4S binding protein [Chloroflexota bacterium]
MCLLSIPRFRELAITKVSRLISFLLTARRRYVQAFSFLVMNSFVLQSLKAVPCLGMNCYACPAAIFACPIGTLQHFAAIHQFPFYTLGVLGLVGALMGRLACGWLCPFGWFQELMYGLGRRLRPEDLHPTTWRWPDQWVSSHLGWLRYAFLIMLVGIVPFFTHEPWFSKLCPVGTIEAGIPWILLDAGLRAQAGWLFVVKVVILLGFLVWMLGSKRPFCRLVCPLGAIWSPFNRLSTLRLAVDETSCSQCGLCRRVCPVDICIYEDANSTGCIRCMECVRACPEAAIRLLGEEDKQICRVTEHGIRENVKRDMQNGIRKT